jgi:hypothetical protein
MLKTVAITGGGGGNGTGTVTLVNTDANLTGGPITTTGTIGLANVITFGQGNVTLTNTSVGIAVVNVNALNAAVNGLNAQAPVDYATTTNLPSVYNNGTSGVGATLTANSTSKTGVAYATTVNLSGVYSNGTAGVGANITASSNSVFTIDGTTPPTTTRILVKNQTNAPENGVYTVTVAGDANTKWVITRATDYDQTSEINAGDKFAVTAGAVNAGTSWIQQTGGSVAIGTTNLVFFQNGPFYVDGSFPLLNDRILVKDQADQTQNGAYTVTTLGNSTVSWVLTRATDYNQTSQIDAGDAFFVQQGTTNKNSTWVEQTLAPVTMGSTSITFFPFNPSSIKVPYTPNLAVYSANATSLTLGVLPITGGGTNANTATQALNNLGGIGIGKAIAMAIIFGGG